MWILIPDELKAKALEAPELQHFKSCIQKKSCIHITCKYNIQIITTTRPTLHTPSVLFLMPY